MALQWVATEIPQILVNKQNCCLDSNTWLWDSFNLASEQEGIVEKSLQNSPCGLFFPNIRPILSEVQWGADVVKQHLPLAMQK